MNQKCSRIGLDAADVPTSQSCCLHVCCAHSPSLRSVCILLSVICLRIVDANVTSKKLRYAKTFCRRSQNPLYSPALFSLQPVSVNMATAAAAGVGELQKELVCPICLDYFDDPVILKCGHNFCRGCILMHWEENGDDDVGYRCPECRQVCSSS